MEEKKQPTPQGSDDGGVIEGTYEVLPMDKGQPPDNVPSQALPAPEADVAEEKPDDDTEASLETEGKDQDLAARITGFVERISEGINNAAQGFSGLTARVLGTIDERPLAQSADSTPDKSDKRAVQEQVLQRLRDRQEERKQAASAGTVPQSQAQQPPVLDEDPKPESVSEEQESTVYEAAKKQMSVDSVLRREYMRYEAEKVAQALNESLQTTNQLGNKRLQAIQAEIARSTLIGDRASEFAKQWINAEGKPVESLDSKDNRESFKKAVVGTILFSDEEVRAKSIESLGVNDTELYYRRFTGTILEDNGSITKTTLEDRLSVWDPKISAHTVMQLYIMQIQAERNGEVRSKEMTITPDNYITILGQLHGKNVSEILGAIERTVADDLYETHPEIEAELRKIARNIYNAVNDPAYRLLKITNSRTEQRALELFAVAELLKTLQMEEGSETSPLCICEAAVKRYINIVLPEDNSFLEAGAQWAIDTGYTEVEVSSASESQAPNERSALRAELEQKDVALRATLRELGLEEVQIKKILETKNQDLVTSFLKGIYTANLRPLGQVLRAVAVGGAFQYAVGFLAATGVTVAGVSLGTLVAVPLGLYVGYHMITGLGRSAFSIFNFISETVGLSITYSFNNLKKRIGLRVETEAEEKYKAELDKRVKRLMGYIVGGVAGGAIAWLFGPMAAGAVTLLAIPGGKVVETIEAVGKKGAVNRICNEIRGGIPKDYTPEQRNKKAQEFVKIVEYRLPISESMTAAILVSTIVARIMGLTGMDSGLEMLLRSRAQIDFGRISTGETQGVLPERVVGLSGAHADVSTGNVEVTSALSGAHAGATAGTGSVELQGTLSGAEAGGTVGHVGAPVGEIPPAGEVVQPHLSPLPTPITVSTAVGDVISRVSLNPGGYFEASIPEYHGVSTVFQGLGRYITGDSGWTLSGNADSIFSRLSAMFYGDGTVSLAELQRVLTPEQITAWAKVYQTDTQGLIDVLNTSQQVGGSIRIPQEFAGLTGK